MVPTMRKEVAAWMPTSEYSRAGFRSGYTLIEVVIAVAIAASVIAMSAPSMIRAVERSQERQVLASVISRLDDMRAQSVLDSRDMHSVAVAADLQTHLPDGWELHVPEDFVLSRKGFCSGEIQLETPHARVVAVSSPRKLPCSFSADAT